MKRFALPLSLAAGALLLSGCAGTTEGAEADAPAEASESADAATLSHPTVEGLEISFEDQPETLVMDCYAYSTLHEYGIEPDALFGFDCENPFVMGDIDINGIERVGQDGEIDVEKLAELRPDAVIGQGDAGGWSWFDDDVNAQLTRVADFIPLASAETVDEAIAANREIAVFLGADPAAENITQADEDYAQAKEAFSEAVGQNELDIMLTSPSKEMLYTAVGFAQASLLEELGATVTGPPAPETGNPWGQVAWEEASTYPADIILVEGYSEEYDFSAELWDNLPAVEAEQLGNWGSKGAMTSRTYADWLGTLTEQVSTSEQVA